jgi:hypothetical protein
MEFSKTKLPQNPLIAEAYKFSLNQMLGIVLQEFIVEHREQVELQYQQDKMALDMARKSQEISKEDYDAQKSEIENLREQNIKLGPAILKRDLEKIFVSRRLAIAEELTAAGNVAPEAIAAALLLECVRSLPDYKEIENNFGPAVTDIVGEVLHIDAYPTERANRLPQLSDEAKKICLCIIICDLAVLQKKIQQIKKDAPNQIFNFPPGQEQRLFADARALVQVDKGLAQKLVTNFNAAAAEVESEFRMEQDDKGALLLVKPPKKPSGPKPPRNNGGFGDAVFSNG